MVLLLPDLRVRQRDYLLEITRAMTAQLDVGEVLRLILRASVAMLAGEVGLIALHDPRANRMRVRAVIGVGAEHVPVFEPLLAPEVMHSESQTFDPAEFDKRLRTVSQALDLPLRQAVALPMYLGQEAIGMIYVFRTFTGTASPNDQRVLQSFADQAAIAVHNARLYEEVVREQKRLASILDHSADGVMILDSQRRIETFNKVMSSISGWPREQAVGKPYDTIVTWASRPEGIDLAEAMQSGWPQGRDGQAALPLFVEGDLLRPDGTRIGVGITYAPLTDGEGRLINIIVNVRDITHFREAQEMKSTFISVVSHELKTPVALIKGYAGTLRREDAHWDRRVVQQSLTVIEEEADRLTDLIENLLAATKLQAEGMRLKYEDVSLVTLAQASVTRMKTQTDKHRFVVAFAPDFPVIPGDSLRLRQVLDNLVSNAVKYSPDGGEVRLEGAYDDEWVRISVSDQGVGLPQDEWERIFQRFYRVDDALTRRTQGTGLGLYLSRAVVEAHGGTIGVTSTPKQGSVFSFTLPRHQAYQ